MLCCHKCLFVGEGMKLYTCTCLVWTYSHYFVGLFQFSPLPQLFFNSPRARLTDVNGHDSVIIHCGLNRILPIAMAHTQEHKRKRWGRGVHFWWWFLHLVCMVFGTAIPTSPFIFGKCFYGLVCPFLGLSWRYLLNNLMKYFCWNNFISKLLSLLIYHTDTAKANAWVEVVLMCKS